MPMPELIRSLLAGLLIVLLAFVLIRYSNIKTRIAVIFILFFCASIKILCSLDPYLHEWEERYHGLVAKNLIDQPFKPVLYKNPVEPYSFKDWTSNHIWLSKPPIPLWFMAGSLAIFGTNEISLRIPGIVFSLLAVFLTFLIARKLFDDKVAILACALHGIHGMSTDLASGRVSSDGVETCFLFFVELTIYFIVMYRPGKLSLLQYLFVGFLTGLSVMCKWQPAFLCLIILLVFHSTYQNPLKHQLFSFLAFVTSTFVFMPWLIYIHLQFPEETNWMLKSLFIPLDDPNSPHQGEWYAQITNFGNYFGYPTLIAVIFILVSRTKTFDINWRMLAVWALVPLIIFSIADMKRGTYLMISAPACFILVSTMILNRFPLLTPKYSFKIMGWISLVMIVGYSLEKLYLFSPDKFREPQWSSRIKNTEYAPGSVIYNEAHAIELMFYHDDVTAYTFDKKD